MEKRPETNKAQMLWLELSLAASEAVTYVDETFELGTVNVQIQDCRSPFIKDLPPELSRSFNHLSVPAKKISSIDMQLSYDRAESLFKPNEIKLHLDNQYQVVFARTSLNAEGKKITESSLFYPLLLTPDGKAAIKREEVQLMRQGTVYEILSELGIDIPTSPQHAEWAAVEGILQFSGRWTAQSEHTALMDLYSRLRAEERIDGVGLMASLNKEDIKTKELEDNLDEEDISTEELEDNRIREINIDIELSKDPAGLPTHALRFTQFVDPSGEQHIEGVHSIPIKYIPEFLGQPQTIRIQTGEGTPVMPDIKMVRFIRESIFQAQQASVVN